MKFIKSFFIILFCLQLTLPFIISGILRLPNLVVHFVHHNHEHNTVGFIDFVHNHYAEKHHDEDHHEHEDLPFHNHSETTFNQIIAINFEPKDFVFIQNKIIDKKPKKIIFLQDFFPSNVSLSIWKPPKIA